MFRLNRAALNDSVVKVSHQTQRKYFFPVSEATKTEGVMCHHLGGDTALKQGLMCCTQRTSSSTLAQTLQSFISPPWCCGQTSCQRSAFCSTYPHLNAENDKSVTWTSGGGKACSHWYTAHTSLRNGRKSHQNKDFFCNNEIIFYYNIIYNNIYNNNMSKMLHFTITELFFLVNAAFHLLR